MWKQDVLKLLHPAGFKLFGEVAIATLLNSQMFDRGLNNINSLNDSLIVFNKYDIIINIIINKNIYIIIKYFIII